jgi:phosphohistidine phosphatase SixA
MRRAGRACADGCAERVSKRTLFVVRHAIAEDRQTWHGSDDDRPLIDQGEGQADRLAARLSSEDIGGVVSSRSLRCRQTVEPLSRRLSLRLEDAPLLYEGTAPDVALRYLLDLRQPTVVGCTHGDVIGGIVSLLARQRLIPQDGAKYKKGSTWVLTVEAGQVRTARYLPPP